MPHGGREGLHGEAYAMGVGHRQEPVWSHGHRTRTRTRTAVESEDPNRREAATPSTITWQAGEGRAAGSGHGQEMGVFRAQARLRTAGKGDLQGVPADSCSEEKD